MFVWISHFYNCDEADRVFKMAYASDVYIIFRGAVWRVVWTDNQIMILSYSILCYVLVLMVENYLYLLKVWRLSRSKDTEFKISSTLSLPSKEKHQNASLPRYIQHQPSVPLLSWMNDTQSQDRMPGVHISVAFRMEIFAKVFERIHKVWSVWVSLNTP